MEAWADTFTYQGELEVKCRPKNNVPFIFTVEGNLDPALCDEDAMIEEILEEIDPPPTPENGWKTVRQARTGRSRGQQ